MTQLLGVIDHVAFTVSDMERACAFYFDVLGGEQVSDYAPEGRSLTRGVVCGGCKISVHQSGNGVDLVARRPTVGAVDICFRWNGPIETAIAHLERHGVEIIDGPSPRTSNDGRPAKSVYFRDLDGNLLEFMSVD
jgi:catechol 2,3-dioxygenase-like lactoylglutathione lyase family enzyme